MVTEELKSKKGQTDVSHHRTFDDTKAAAVAHWLPLKAADCSATVGPIPRQFHTHLSHLQSIYTLPGQTAAEWALPLIDLHAKP